jgi:hypothetical protein
MTRGGQVNRNPGTERLATEARSTSPIPSYTEAGRAGQLLSSEGGTHPQIAPSRLLAGASSNLVKHNQRRGGWGRGLSFCWAVLALIFLTGCSTPRIIAGDSTSQTFYLKQKLATF